MQLHERTGIKPNFDGFTVITDIETDGANFYEEFCNASHAQLVVNCVSGWDDLVAQRDELLAACKEVSNAVCFGEIPWLHGHQRQESAYYQFLGTSSPIRKIKQAIKAERQG